MNNNILSAIKTLSDGNAEVLAAYEQLPAHEKPHYQKRVQSMINAPSKMLLLIQIEEIEESGVVAGVMKQLAREGKLEEIVYYVTDQMKCGAEDELKRLFGERLLERIVNFKM